MPDLRLPRVGDPESGGEVTARVDVVLRTILVTSGVRTTPPTLLLDLARALRVDLPSLQAYGANAREKPRKPRKSRQSVWTVPRPNRPVCMRSRRTSDEEWSLVAAASLEQDGCGGVQESRHRLAGYELTTVYRNGTDGT